MRTSKADRLSDPDAWRTLKKLYEDNVPEGMSQEQFGQRYGIGSQGMVWQYLNGHTPLTVEACARFARGLGVKIEDISPILGDALHKDIIPMLGKKLRRAALLVLCCTAGLLPQEADASTSPVLHKNTSQYTFSAIWRKLRSILNRIANPQPFLTAS